MKNNFLTLIFIVGFSLSCFTQTISNQVGIGSQSTASQSVVQCNTGGYLLSASAGLATGDKSCSLIGGTRDMWLLRIDDNYSIQWEQCIGSMEEDIAVKAIETSDGGFYIAGMTNSPSPSGNSTVSANSFDYWLLRLDQNGGIVWQESYGGMGIENLTDMIIVGDTNIVLFGSSQSDAGVDKSEDNYGSTDLWVVSLDTNGVILWDKTLGGSTSDDARNISYDPIGEELYACGLSLSDATGNKTEDSYGAHDVWIVKLDLNGNIIDQKIFGGDNDEIEGHFFIDDSNQMYITAGTTSGPSGNKTSDVDGIADLWILKIDNQFNIVWDKSFGGNGVEGGGHSMISTPTDLIFTGNSNSNISGDKTENSRGWFDVWVLSVDATSGELHFDKTIGGDTTDFALSIFEKPGGGLALFNLSGSGISGDKTVPNVNPFPDPNNFWIFDLDTDLGIESNFVDKTSFFYPNPSSTTITLSEGSFGDVSVYDLSGRSVISYKDYGPSIDISSLNKGAYFIEWMNEGQMHREQLIKE